MRRLGQHFLTNRSVLYAIAEAVDPHAGETIVEIGAGHGELTSELGDRLQVAGYRKGPLRIIAIEKDVRLAELLRKKFADDARIQIVHGDALKTIPTTPVTYNLQPATYKIAGNIPYYITGRLLRILGELDPKPSRIVLTMQQEVAERICAKPPRMNRLAAIVQFWAEPKITRTIPKADFRPPPEVDSAVLLLRTHQTPPEADPEQYAGFVRTAFSQPRKTLMNNLRSRFPADEVSRAMNLADLPPSARPQNASLAQLIALAQALI